MKFESYSAVLNDGLCYCWLLEKKTPDHRGPEMNRLFRELVVKERALETKLDQVREKYQHSGNTGHALELSFREFLKELLPRKYEIGHGEIIDSFGEHAGDTAKDGQIDVVILDGEQLQLSSLDEPGLFLSRIAL